MTSPFKAYLAGVGTVAVAIAIGFGGGLLIAERFGSDTAVPEQSKIEKQRNTEQAETSQVPVAKPVVTQTLGAAVNDHPRPSPQAFAPVVSAPSVTANQQPAANPQSSNPMEAGTSPEDHREAAPTAERQVTSEVTPVEPRQPEARQPAIAAQPQQKNERPPLRSERKQTARPQNRAPKSEARRQDQNQSQTVPRENVAETDGSAGQSSTGREMSAYSETRPNSKKSRQMRVRERRETNDVMEEEEQEMSESAEITTEYRRPPVGLPFLGLFAR